MKINKLSIIILIISIFFFGFSFIRDIERQKQEDKRNQDIINCITNAEEGFLGDQYKECKALKIMTGECVDIIEKVFEEYVNCFEY
jgi:Na+/H+-translocating membrane pyrophosphatase